MAVIRANRESIDDRFSVLGFTVRSELPLFEIGLATDPELLKPESRARRTPGNFFTSRLLRALPSQRGEAVYLVPPEVVARFVGQQRLYFGLATYRESDRSTPISLRMPDRGTMYVSLSGLSERGLRRTARSRGTSAYGSTGYGSTGYGGSPTELGWGGDAASASPPPSRDEDRTTRAGNGTKAANGASDTVGYSDGYSEDLWKQPPPVTAAPDTATAPATAQGMTMRNGNGNDNGRRPIATSRSLLISSDYQPSNFWDALRAQAGFFLDSAMWYLGVLNTTVMPHSAICQIRVPDGTAEGGLHGSGFFIGPRLIMTAAHVVDGQSELIVVPGKNGGGTAGGTEPFGRFRVTTFSKHDSYGSNGSDYDMALIQVPAANAVGNGQYFDLVEELNQSRPEGVVVSGYAARWYANDLIEHFVNQTIDPNRQHMMGGYIRELPTDETFSYNIQTLGGTSGSPVYWIEDTGAGPQAHMVGVHVAAHDATTNLGCRITPNKLAWIRRIAAQWGQTLTFSMGRYAQSLSAVCVDSGHRQGSAAAQPHTGSHAQGLALRHGYSTAQEIITPYYDPADPMSALTCQADAFSQAREEWFAGVPNTTIFPHSAICLLEMQDAAGSVSRGTGFYIGRNRILTCAHNLYNKASVTIIPGKNGNGGASTEPFGRTTVTSSSWRIPASYAGSNRATDLAVIDNVPIDAPNGQWFDSLEELNQSRPEGVVVCGYSSRSTKVPELTAAIDGFRQHLHAGYIAALADDDSTFSYPILTLKRASGSPVYYISTQGGQPHSYVVGVHTGADTDDLNRGCRLMQNKIDWIEGRTTTLSLGHTASRALGDAFSIHWHDVPMTYQTSPMSCWAAAASMVVGWRDQQSIPDSAIAEKVPVFNAFRNGLYGHERGFVADAWNLMAEAPASYTIEAWRDMLANNGPLYIDQVASAAGGGHVRVLVGMTSGGATDGSDTTMHLHDPARGPIKIPFSQFLTLYEGRTANTGGYLQYQIMHSGGIPDARRPSHTAAFSLGAATANALAYGRALGNDGPADHPVHLIPQPDKNACWAASMAMLLAHRRQQSRTPESIINEIGGSLASSYGWDLLNTARDHYGFRVIDQPSNASIYHAPRQWAEWLNTYGPLWVVIVGAPHAVVVAGIRGNLDDANATQVKILNPWDTRIAFDSDPVAFHPANHGYEDWLPFADFAADFGNMAQHDYGNWRILHLPVATAHAQSLSMSMRGNSPRLAAPPPSVRALNAAGERREPIEPSRVLGTRMSRTIGEAGASRWALDQLEGLKSPATLSPSVSSAATGDVRIVLNDWPAIEGAPTPLPLTVEFRHNNGSVGDVRIAAGMPANLTYGVEVLAKIEDCADADGVARLRVRVDYHFHGLAQGNPDATIELCLRGDGRYERDNGWRTPDVLSPAA